MKLEQNVGPLDQVTRLVLGSVLVAVAYFLKIGGLLGGIIFWVGIVTVSEGILGYCFLYGVLGWSTKRRRGRLA